MFEFAAFCACQAPAAQVTGPKPDAEKTASQMSPSPAHVPDTASRRPFQETEISQMPTRMQGPPRSTVIEVRFLVASRSCSLRVSFEVATPLI
jgi:hypothetical protein